MTSPWKDPQTHREPKWPVGGFAPGNYIARCRSCDHQFTGMDKRAYQCFPCAVDHLHNDLFETRKKLVTVEKENGVLKDAIQIINRVIQIPQGSES